MYLDVKKKHFYKQSLDDRALKDRTESIKESDYTYLADLRVTIFDNKIFSNFKVKENDKEIDSEYFYLNRYDGYFRYEKEQFMVIVAKN